MLFLRLVLCAICLFALLPVRAAGRRERYAGQPSPSPCPGAHTGAGQLPAGRSPGAAFSAPRRVFGMPPQRAHACGSRRGRRRPVALPCALPARLPARRSHRPCLLSQRRGGHAPPAPAFKTEHPARRRLAPKRGRPGDTLSFKGYIYHVLGLCGACRIARILFVAAYFYNWIKTAHGQSEAG